MKKTLIVTVSSFVFLVICSFVAYLLGGYGGEKATSELATGCLITGLIILAVSGIIVFFAKENIPLNILCSVLSAAALGFCIRAWYIFRGLENDLYVMVLVSLAAAAYLWLYFILSKIAFFENRIILYTVLFLILSVSAYIPLVIFTKTTFLSTFGYYILIELAFVYAVLANSEGKRSLLRDFTLSTYSVFGIAVLMVAIAALCLASGDGDCDCDCDCVDCCDCCDIGTSAHNGKRKRNNSKM